MKTSDIILAIMGVTMLLFIFACFVFTWYGRIVSDTLIASFFAAMGGEGFFMAWIKITKTKKGNDNNGRIDS